MTSDCTYLYFKPSGKWKYEGRGRFPALPAEGFHRIDRYEIMRHNDGTMPGIISNADDLIVVVIPDEGCDAPNACPHMLMPVAS